MSSVRELLESAAPAPQRAPLPAAEVRRRGDRRRRRGIAVGAATAAAAVACASLIGLRLVEAPASRSDRAAVGTPSPVPSRTLNWTPLRALEGTRWVPDLVAMKATGTQAYPDESGRAPRALLTFEKGGVLVLDVMLPDTPVVTVRGTWEAVSTWPDLDETLLANVTLRIEAPAGAPDPVVALVSRLALVATAEGHEVGMPPPSLEPVTLFLYGSMHTGVLGVIDQVRPDAVLPSPYPSRP